MLKITPEQKIKLRHIIKMAVLVLIVVCVVNFLFGCDGDRKRGAENQNVISFTGHGEISAVPDIANIDFTIEKDAKSIKEAQTSVAGIEKKSLEFLRNNNVADKDIKTINSSFYPKYEYQYEKQACTEFGCPPPIGKNVIIGYTATESIAVKIRNTDDAGKIIEGLGGLGVSNLNGPNFAIDKEDALKDSARKLAIIEAKMKAKVLAKDLGVHLGKITSFSENGNYPGPMYDRINAVGAAKEMAFSAELPKGENLITSDVTITYEIK